MSLLMKTLHLFLLAARCGDGVQIRGVTIVANAKGQYYNS